MINFRESAVLLPVWSFELEIGGITSCQIELIDNNNSNNHSIDETGSNSKIFEFGVDSLEMDGVIIDELHRLINLSSHLDHNARIYIRFPVFLKSYSVNIRLRCKLITSNSWSEWTNEQKINIPSSLITRTFDVDEKILFNPLHSNHSIPGTIRKIMDAEKELYQVEAGVIRRKIWNDIHSSRIFRNGPRLRNIVIDIDRMTQTHITKQLLFGTDCIDEYDVIFHTLSDIYEEYAENLCDENHDFDSIIDTDYPFIGRFVTNHIMEFLLDLDENKLRFNTIKCIFNHNHGLMRIVPVWHSSLVNHIEITHHKNSDLIVVNPD